MEWAGENIGKSESAEALAQLAGMLCPKRIQREAAQPHPSTQVIEAS
jgi:hypothetical protein